MASYKTLAGILALALSGFATVASADFQFRYPSSVQFKTGMTGGGESAPQPEVSPEEALQAWEDFATQNSLSYGADWNSISWQGTPVKFKDFSELPTEPYPNAAPTGGINIRYANIGSLAGFAHVTSIGGNLQIWGNATVSSVDGGFSRLASIGGSVILQADIPMPNLEFVGGAFSFSGPTFAHFPKLRTVAQLTATGLVDASSLAQLENVTGLSIVQGLSMKPGFVPLPSSSWICQSAGESLFANDGNYAEQWELCGETKGPWESFAIANGLRYSPNMTIVSWTLGTFASLPTEPFPNPNPESVAIESTNPAFVSLESLSTIETVDGLLLLKGAFASLDGLRNLRSARSITITSPNLMDISGLANVETLTSSLSIPTETLDKPGFVRIPSSSALCRAEYASKFTGGQSRYCQAITP